MRTRLYKLVPAVLALCLSQIHVNAQYAGADALKLRRYMTYVGGAPLPNGGTTAAKGYQFDAAELTAVAAILQPYTDSANGIPYHTKAGVLQAFNSNVFISRCMPGTAQAPEFVNGLKAGGSMSANFLASAGGLDVTTVADGLAKFIVKRTKQELNIAFFSRLQQEMAKPEYKDMRTIFPQTYSTLTVVGDQIYNYTVYLQALREAFNNDLKSLAANLPLVTGNHPDFFSSRPYLTATLQSACYVANGLNEQQHPGNILNDYPQQYLDALNPNVSAGLRTLQLFSASLRNTDPEATDNWWISAEDIAAIANDTTTLRLYIGLVYQQLKSKPIVFTTTRNGVTVQDTLATVLAAGYRDMSVYRSYLTTLAAKTNKLTTLIKTYEKQKNDSMKVEQFATYAYATTDLLEYAAQAGTLAPPKWQSDPNKSYLFHLKDSLADYFDVARSATALTLNINRKQYASAIVNLVHIYDLIYNKPFSLDVKLYVDAVQELRDAKMTGNVVKAIAAGNADSYAGNLPEDKKKHAAAVKSVSSYCSRYRITVKAGDKHLPDAKNATLVLTDLLRYGTFMAGVVQAKTPDEVEEAIEAFALPPGSSRIKRESLFNVSVNAYAGLFTGYERIHGLQTDNTVAINSYGVTAPIGIAVSGVRAKFLGMPAHRQYGHWSYSAFVSVIDLGAVAAFRFVNDSAAQVPQIKLKDIISPGLFFSIGIPKCPLSVNLGAQVGPNLRTVGANQNAYANNTYIRYSISFVTDLPLLNLYTKSAD